MDLARSKGRADGRAEPCRACFSVLLATALYAPAPALAQEDALHAACLADARTQSLACRGRNAWASPPSADGAIAIVGLPAIVRSPAIVPGGAPGPETAFDAIGLSSVADSARVSAAWVILGAAAGAVIVGIPAALIGHDIDRGLHEDEVSESPGLVGAYAGLFLGGGIGGVLGAHVGSGRRGSPWLPLGIVGAAIPLMLIDFELGLVPPVVGVVVAVAIEINAGQARIVEPAAPR